MGVLLLLTSALAAPLFIPPGEDAAAWQAAAQAAGVPLADGAGLMLVHDGPSWFLIRDGDLSQRWPIPAPTTPEQRAAVLKFAAELATTASPSPLPAPPPLAVEPDISIAHTPEVAMSEAEAASVEADANPPPPAPPPPPPPPRPRRNPLRWVPGWTVGLDVGAMPIAAEPRPVVGFVGGWRAPWGGRAAAVLHLSPPMPVADGAATLAREELRAEVGYRYAILGVGAEWGAVRTGDTPQGDLLYPTVYAGGELPLTFGPLRCTPHAGVGVTLADLHLLHGGNDYVAGIFRVETGFRLELTAGAPR